MLKIWYGTETNHLDVTDHFNKMFISELMIIKIPAGTNFNKLYKDLKDLKDLKDPKGPKGPKGPKNTNSVIKKIRIIFHDTIVNINENKPRNKEIEFDLSYAIPYRDLSISYGNDKTFIDVTYKFRKRFISKFKRVFIKQYVNFNRIFGDPIFGVIKIIIIKFGEVIHRIIENAPKKGEISFDISKPTDFYLTNLLTDNYTNLKIYDNFYSNLFKSRILTSKYILEIAVLETSSKLWNDYFPYSIIYSLVDISNLTENFINDANSDDSRIVLISNKNAYKLQFVESFFKNNCLKFDIIIDTTPHTIKSLHPLIELYSSLLTNNGIFIIENIKNTFQLNKIKNLIPKSLEYYLDIYKLDFEERHIIVINKNKTMIAPAC